VAILPPAALGEIQWELAVRDLRFLKALAKNHLAVQPAIHFVVDVLEARARQQA
jgi:hypothetical protein